MEIDDNKYDALLAFIETGSQGDLPEELIEYISILELIRGMHMRYENRNAIVKFIQQPPYGLSEYHATQYYTDAINLFYLSNEIKRQAWRNVYAEKLDRAADLVLMTATTSKDIDIYKNIIYAIKDFRQLGEPEPDDIPEEFFKKPVKIYTLDPTQVGRSRPDRNLLAKHIDKLDIPETDKQRIKSDAMIEEIEFLSNDED